jgi:hypothetical protein
VEKQEISIGDGLRGPTCKSMSVTRATSAAATVHSVAVGTRVGGAFGGVYIVSDLLNFDVGGSTSGVEVPFDVLFAANGAAEGSVGIDTGGGGSVGRL